MKDKLSKNNGITLIALTITIFMIIVLAAIAIASILATENSKKNMYVQKYEQIVKELENKKTPIEEIQLAVVDAIGENGFDLELAEKVLKENLKQEELKVLTINKETKEISGKYRDENFKINEFGKVQKVVDEK